MIHKAKDRPLKKGMLIIGLAIIVSPGCSVFRNTATDQHVTISRDLTLKGLQANHLQNETQAEQFFTSAVHSDPENIEARMHLAELYRQRNSLEAAIQQLERCNRLSPGNCSVMTELGNCYADSNDNARALELADSALRQNRESIEAWKLKAKVLWRMGRRKESLADYQRGLHLDPNDTEIRRNMARLYMEIDKPLRALTTLDMIANEYDEQEVPEQLLVDQALALRKMDRLPEAIDRMRVGFERNSFSESFAQQYVAALIDAGELQQATSAIRIANRQYPQSNGINQLWAKVQNGNSVRLAQFESTSEIR